MPRLDSVAWLGKVQDPLADQAALQLFADARLFGAGGDAAPILLTFGKKAERVQLTVDISAPALPAVARLFALETSP